MKGIRVLIVGGGFAGLHAADLLARQGFLVRLLEAADRFGGKALGGFLGGHPYDLGCQSFSKDMKRVRALGQRFGLTEVPRPWQASFYLRGGELVKGAALAPVQKELHALEDDARSRYAELELAVLRPELAARSVMDWAAPRLGPLAAEYFRSAFASEWCQLPERVSLLHYLEFQRGFDAEHEEMDFRFREGLFRAAEGLSEALGDRATLRCPLESVELTEAGVRARAGGQEFEADYAVLALPLPQLRRLPIQGTGAGPLAAALAPVEEASVRKVLVAYEQPIPGTAREGTFASPLGLTVMDNSDAEAGLFSLAAFLGGPAAAENLGREALLERLAAVFGPAARHPLDYREQAWLGDGPYLSGGFACNRRPSRRRGAATGVPVRVGGRIFIAGSEAAREFPSYVEGALFSAELAAAGIAQASG